MFVIMGTTRGDELICSTSVPLFAATTKGAAQAKLNRIKSDSGAWLAAHTVPWWAQAGVFDSFEVVEVAG